jgi:hypothetical protein
LNYRWRDYDNLSKHIVWERISDNVRAYVDRDTLIKRKLLTIFTDLKNESKNFGAEESAALAHRVIDVKAEHTLGESEAHDQVKEGAEEKHCEGKKGQIDWKRHSSVQIQNPDQETEYYKLTVQLKKPGEFGYRIVEYDRLTVLIRLG